mmetsp:Transcript_11656/g.25587  ORF Transcript_11656/g.25587 Transcript_11656/m.25587 type:complete len:233 (-) Transcript_11656:2685-3383(-)
MPSPVAVMASTGWSPVVSSTPIIWARSRKDPAAPPILVQGQDPQRCPNSGVDRVFGRRGAPACWKRELAGGWALARPPRGASVEEPSRPAPAKGSAGGAGAGAGSGGAGGGGGTADAGAAAKGSWGAGAAAVWGTGEKSPRSSRSMLFSSGAGAGGAGGAGAGGGVGSGFAAGGAARGAGLVRAGREVAKAPLVGGGGAPLPGMPPKRAAAMRSFSVISRGAPAEGAGAAVP